MSLDGRMEKELVRFRFNQFIESIRLQHVYARFLGSAGELLILNRYRPNGSDKEVLQENLFNCPNRHTFTN